MRFEGILQDWNYERGFGAIAPAQGGQRLFVHASAFPADGVAPVLGEALSFGMAVDAKGQKKAVQVLRRQGGKLPPKHSLWASAPQRTRGGGRRGSTWLVAALVLLVAGLALHAWVGSIRPPDHSHAVALAPAAQAPIGKLAKSAGAAKSAKSANAGAAGKPALQASRLSEQAKHESP